MNCPFSRVGTLLTSHIVCSVALAAPAEPATAVEMFPLSAVRILDGPFAKAADANREYLLALDPDRLLAPFQREAGLKAKAPSYENWENSGLDGHTAGHYLSALADMIAAGEDTADGELRRRLDYMLAELERCQEAHGDGYIGGVPESRRLWREVAAGNVDAVRQRWVPWYNVHKTFAGLRDVYRRLGNKKARILLVKLGDWCVDLLSGISDEQFQRMLEVEHGGMNEALADIYAITGEKKYLDLAKRFNHRAVSEPLMRHKDSLTGLHANTQIPKVVGMERIARLSADQRLHDGARFFWKTVTGHRSVAFGGNSVSEHFNDPHDFRSMLDHREGPETCNTYNMLRLTELLFAAEPQAAYADYYERALYNHILTSIHSELPGYVYFTPIRPEHYRVYSQPSNCFWCCVGTGMENPGKYGEFIYARDDGGIYVNLFIPSELTISDGIGLSQKTDFPFEESTKIKLKLGRPATFNLHIRHPAWVAAGALKVSVNGQAPSVASTPSSYVKLTREWKDGDTVKVEIPMRTSVERLPDGSNWVAILHGPIVLVWPSGTKDMQGLRADGARMGHVASGPTVPLNEVPVLFTTMDQLPSHVEPDSAVGSLHFHLKGVVEPQVADGIPLAPFFMVHDSRYQMYWELSTPAQIAARKKALVAEEQVKKAREVATIDQVAPGEQQPEVEHYFKGEDTETGIHEGRRWRHGKSFQYMLDAQAEPAIELEVTYWGGDSDRTFDILANDKIIATEHLTGDKPGRFFAKRYGIPADLLNAAADSRITIKFVATKSVAGGVYDLRLIRPGAPQQP